MANANVFLKIPRDRVGVLIGPDGKTKQNIENKLLVDILIDSETGGINLTLKEQNKDPSRLFTAKDVVTAIGRGFSPNSAFRLIVDEDMILDIIDLRLIFGRSESDIRRVKGRVIGMGGKTRRLLEELTDTNISVYGHTIGLTGHFEEIEIAKQAIQMFIRGSQHGTIYRFLHRKRRDLKKKKFELWKKTPEE